MAATIQVVSFHSMHLELALTLQCIRPTILTYFLYYEQKLEFTYIVPYLRPMHEFQ